MDGDCTETGWIALLGGDLLSSVGGNRLMLKFTEVTGRYLLYGSNYLLYAALNLFVSRP